MAQSNTPSFLNSLFVQVEKWFYVQKQRNANKLRGGMLILTGQFGLNNTGGENLIRVEKDETAWPMNWIRSAWFFGTIRSLFWRRTCCPSLAVTELVAGWIVHKCCTPRSIMLPSKQTHPSSPKTRWAEQYPAAFRWRNGWWAQTKGKNPIKGKERNLHLSLYFLGHGFGAMDPLRWLIVDFFHFPLLWHLFYSLATGRFVRKFTDCSHFTLTLSNLNLPWLGEHHLVLDRTSNHKNYHLCIPI